jgi:hypothetical protein
LYTVDTIPLVIWSCAELALINVAACIPTLRPLYLWISGKNPQDPITRASAYGSRYGTGSGRFGRFTQRSAPSTQLESSDENDHNIYQFRTYDVSVKDREDEHSDSTKTDTGIGATFTVQHAY